MIGLPHNRHKTDISKIKVNSDDPQTQSALYIGGHIIFGGTKEFDFLKLMATEYLPVTLLEYHEVQLYVVTSDTKVTCTVTPSSLTTYPDDIETKGWTIDCHDPSKSTVAKAQSFSDHVTYHNKIIGNPFNNSLLIASGMAGLRFSPSPQKLI